MTLEEIKKIPMREVIGRYGLRPDRAGFIQCPFHKEKTGSMKLYPYHAHCFGCGWNGDQVDFVSQMENLTFEEAFTSLGGTYAEDKKGKREARERARKAEIRRREEEERRQGLSAKMREASHDIDVYRSGLESFEVFSDEWTFCQESLFRSLRLYENLQEEMENPRRMPGAGSQDGPVHVPESGTERKEKNRMLNHIVICGRCVKEPELKEVPGRDGSTYTIGKYRVAVTRDRKDKEGKSTVDYFLVRVLNGAAEYAAKYMRKGMWVAVSGRMCLEPYEKDGVRHIAPVIEAASQYPILPPKTADSAEEEKRE